MIAGISFDSYYGPGSPVKIEAFERLAGIALPALYKEICVGFNGAFILNKPVFKFYNRLLGEDVTSGTGMFLPFGEIEGSFETMEIKYQYPPEEFVQGLIIFSALGNGDALCFDYRENRLTDDPSVVMWHHESTPGSDLELSFVAPSFSEFLGKLFERLAE
ncbi:MULTISPECIES: SMI1/KNR4 family protein [unclassified Pseudomonas]|uniref:SMI1/KNR4 family protein n=1 Tax=unclassified Pseudomonas TaxID=196821 RepID=UPI000F5740DE|nr:MULTISPECIES: SMI1/KNR4 family protein [unclassified Pseudomonas]